MRTLLPLYLVFLLASQISACSLSPNNKICYTDLRNYRSELLKANEIQAELLAERIENRFKDGAQNPRLLSHLRLLQADARLKAGMYKEAEDSLSILIAESPDFHNFALDRVSKTYEHLKEQNRFAEAYDLLNRWYSEDFERFLMLKNELYRDELRSLDNKGSHNDTK